MKIRVIEEEARTPAYWPAVVMLLGLVVYLVGFFPYASGYGEDRLTLLATLRSLWSYPDWSHGALAPLIVLGLLYYQRAEIFRGPVAGSAWGLPVLCAGFFFFWVGYKTNVYYFGFGAIQLLFAGAILWLAGREGFRRVFFHWCFLAFAWPLFFLSDVLAFKLRLVMVAVSSRFLEWIGVANLMRGTAIESPADSGAGLEQGARFALDIADPCSGIRSLFALLMVAALWGYLRLQKPSQRIALVVLAVPLAVLGNFVRVNLLVGASILVGPEFAVGVPGDPSTFHFLAGIAVFVVALGGMVFLGALMRSGWRVLRREKVVRTRVEGGTAMHSQA